MSKSACKCKKPHECEECPEWIFTLADLVMCMMGLFVILWVLKPGPTGGGEGLDGAEAGQSQEWVAIAAAVRQAFGYKPKPDSDDPVDIHMLQNILGQLNPRQGPDIGGPSMMEVRGAEGSDPEVESIRPGPQAAIGGRLLFPPGETELTDALQGRLDEIARVIRGHRNIVMVKGHTSLDDLPTDASAAEQMDLSLRRAQVVADYLVNHGVDPEVLRIQGCSTFEPVARTWLTDGHAVNRRVEVDVMATLVEVFQDRAPTVGSPSLSE